MQKLKKKGVALIRINRRLGRELKKPDNSISEATHEAGRIHAVGGGSYSLSEPRTQTPCTKAKWMWETWLIILAVSKNACREQSSDHY